MPLDGISSASSVTFVDARGGRMAGRSAAVPTPAGRDVGEPVIDRAFALLNSFDPAHRELSLTDLSRRSGLPMSTALRMARRLVAWGALERHGGGYVVGLRLWEVASL